MSSQLTNIMKGVMAGLALVNPARTVTDTYQESADRGDDALAPGVYTVIAAGRPDSDTNLYYQDFILLGQGMILPATLENSDNGTPGAQLNEAEGEMLDELQHFALSFSNQVEIHGSRQSLQLASPYYWVAMDIRVGPFTMDITADPSLEALEEITFTIDAESPEGGAPSVQGTATLPQS